MDYGTASYNPPENVHIYNDEVPTRDNEETRHIWRSYIADNIRRGKAIRFIIIMGLIIVGFAIMAYFLNRQQKLLHDYDNRLMKIHENVKKSHRTLLKKIDVNLYKSHQTLLKKVDVNINKSQTLLEKIDANLKESMENKGKIKKILQYIGDKKDCIEWYKKGGTVNGVYSIHPNLSTTVKVYCDQITDGGGWTVFQRRVSGSISFYRGWEEYKRGFGDFNNNFWLGNIYLNILTRMNCELRVDMERFNGKKIYAKYSTFSVGDEASGYKLSVGGYTGNAVDQLASHNGMKFSTKDKDNDVNSGSCSVTYHGAWWYKRCYYSNLNGKYYPSENSNGDGIVWSPKNVKSVELKIRPKSL